MATTGGTGAGGTPATSGGGAGSPSQVAGGVPALRVKAQELAGQIAADGRTLDELDASYQAAEIAYRQLTARQAALQRSMAAAAASVASARKVLKDQAILAYLAGGAPVITYIPDRPGLDPSLTVAYAEIVAGGEKDAMQTYRATLDVEARQKAALDANAEQAGVALAVIRSDKARAAATLASQQQALSQVKGHLAVEVALVQAQQRAAEQAQEMAALAARGDLPPSAPQAPAPPSPAQATTAGSGQVGTRPTYPPSTRQASPVLLEQPPGSSAPPTSTSTTAPPAAPKGGSTSTGGSAPPTGTAPPSSGSTPAQAPGVDQVLAYARAQLGKPYQWGGAGPDSFDCSGLVMMAWQQAGIYFPHLAQDQYDLTARIPLSQLIPGDLVFFGTPGNVYHVGIYVGNGEMIDAPETGQNVQVQSIYWDSLLGAGRVTTSS